MRFTTKSVILNSLIAAIYVVLTVVNPIGFGALQFRISEVICMLPFYDRRFIPGCLIGVLIANMFSPLGYLDVITGLSIVIIAYFVADTLIKSLYGKLIFYSLDCGFGVGLELYYLTQVPFYFSFFSVFISTLIIAVISIPINKLIVKAVRAS